MLNEASEFDTNKPARIAAFIKALDLLVYDEYHSELYDSDEVKQAYDLLVKAAKKLGIPTKIRIFNNYTIKVPNKYLANGFKYTPNTKQEFISRFVNKSSTAYKKAQAKAVPVKEKKVSVPKLISTPKTEVEQKRIDAKVNRISIDNMLEGSSLIPDTPLERNKRKVSFMEKVFDNKADRDKVDAWFEKSPLKEIVADPVRLTGIINWHNK
jgi:hypothetical protein